MRVRLLLAGLLCAPLVLSGCVTGYNSVLMATKTNVGVDIQASPPTVDISVGRKEGTIQPVFEGGQTLPVLASVRNKTTTNDGLKLGAGQAFAGGEAAYVMSNLFDDRTPKRGVPFKDGGHKVFLTQKPEIRDKRITFVEPGSVKPMVFATDSAFGLKVSASQFTPALPAAIKFGFTRYEAVFTPVGLRPLYAHEQPGHPGATWVAEIPPVLATVDYSASVSSGKKKKKGDDKDGGSSNKRFGTETGWVQFFAAGESATQLARQDAVRAAMITRLDPVAAAIENFKQTLLSPCGEDLIEQYQADAEYDKLEALEKAVAKWAKANKRDTNLHELIFNPAEPSDQCAFWFWYEGKGKLAPAEPSAVRSRIQRALGAGTPEENAALNRTIQDWLSKHGLKTKVEVFLLEDSHPALDEELLKFLKEKQLIKGD